MKAKSTPLIRMNARDEEAAKRGAIRISEEQPGRYVIVTPAFGLFASVRDHLGKNAPGESAYDWYARNGRVRRFTEKQRIADQEHAAD